MRSGIAKWLWCPLWFVVACTGPGLEPPAGGDLMGGAAGSSFGGSGSGGASGAAGTGGANAGSSSSVPEPDAGVLPGDADAAVEADAAADGGNAYDARTLVGPTYMGSVNNSAACSASYATLGHEPASAASERHPLFLYFVGTEFVPDAANPGHESSAALAVTEAMARRGFVALSVQYDNGALAWLSDHTGQLACLFGASAPASLMARACALPNVNCELGVAAWGHSQGAYIAAMAFNDDPRVRAVWATGFGGDAPTQLPPDRLRVVNGEADAADNGTAQKLNTITGQSATDCPDPDQCLRENGSGWIIVRKRDLAMPDTATADHCWFDRPSCSANMRTLEPNWIDPLSDKPFALERNADWVARMLAAP